MAAEHRSNHPELRGLPGKNDIEQACALLMSRRPSFSTLSWSEQVRAAAAYVKAINADAPHYRMSAGTKDKLKDPSAHPVGPPKPEEAPPSEDEDEQRLSIDDMARLGELSVALQTAAQAGDMAKVRSCLQQIAKITGDNEPVPVGTHAQRMSAVAPFAGRNEIEKSMTFLMSSPKAPPGFDAVPERLRPFAAGRWFRSGETWEDIL